MKISISKISLFCIAIALTSCATIMHGTKQNVGISSNPTDANVWIDKKFIGKTPTMLRLSRKCNHHLRIELEGYEPYQTVFTRKFSGWAFGNIVFGGLIGLAIDGVSGGIFVLTPEHIEAELKNQNVEYTKNSDGSYIFVVLKPNPSWKKVGNLVAVK